jgi:ADP-heptose:LPS heptosyltransferase
MALTQYGAQFQATNNLKEFIKKLAKCRIALTAAGGSSHIASSLGVSVVVISGIKNQSFWRPYGENIKVFENEKNINLIYPVDIGKALKGLTSQDTYKI